MTTLYKMNNSGTITWWEIEEVREPLANSIADQFDDQDDIPRLGYNTWWGNDHKTQTQDTQNTQYTPASNKPTLSVQQQIQSQIDEMIARKGYSRTIPNTPPELPMLAQTWNDFVTKANSLGSAVGHWDSFYFQPKLDGVRCVATPLSLYSRRNTEFSSVPHIEETMNLLLDHPTFHNIKLDGELYLHGSDLQTIQSIVSRKSADHMMYRHVTYQVFDVIDTTLPTNERLAKLLLLAETFNELYRTNPSPRNLPACPIQFVPTGYYGQSTNDASTQSLIQRICTEFRNQGYEGVILRKPEALYQTNYRTFDLIKYKEFADAEFLILDVLEAKNDTGVFLCQTMQGKTFKCSPAWTTERKRQILRYKDNYIGRQLTVKYERISKDGIPLKPIGVTIDKQP